MDWGDAGSPTGVLEAFPVNSAPPRSVWNMTPRTSAPRTAIATCIAAVASTASWRGLIANPTQRRECSSRRATRADSVGPETVSFATKDGRSKAGRE